MTLCQTNLHTKGLTQQQQKRKNRNKEERHTSETEEIKNMNPFRALSQTNIVKKQKFNKKSNKKGNR